MIVWLALNLATLAIAYRIDGWRGVGALLLLEVIACLVLAAVFLYGLAGREQRSKLRIRTRVDGLLANAAVGHHRLTDGCRDERGHGVVPQPDGTFRVYCPNELGEPR